MGSGKHLARSDKRNVGIFARWRTRFSCMMGNHEPNRNKVRRTTGVFFVGVCRNCGTTIRKRHGHAWKACSADQIGMTPDDQSASVESGHGD